jgi:hypothetical protein
MTTFLWEPLDKAKIPFAKVLDGRLEKYGIREFKRPDYNGQDVRWLQKGKGIVRIYDLGDQVEFEASGIHTYADDVIAHHYRKAGYVVTANASNSREDIDEILAAISQEFSIEIVCEDDDRFRRWTPDDERFGPGEDDLAEGDADAGTVGEGMASSDTSAFISATCGDVP